MRWKIKQFEFCDQSRSLKDGGNRIYLEPLLADVLAFFCRHPGEVVARDHLVERVWDAKAVTDNAVSRVIAKLRKALGDNPKAPAFIVTYPKKGYQFIAPVVPIEDSAAQAPLETTRQADETVEPIEIRPDAPNHRPMWLLFCAVLAAFLIVLAWWPNAPHKPSFSVEALTRGGGREVLPALSPNGRILAYSAHVDGRMHLFLKDLKTLDTVEIGDPAGFSGPAAWSTSGEKITFLVTTEEGAFYYVARVEGLALTEKTLVHQGPKGSFGKMGFNHRGDRLLFAEAEGLGQPYILYELDPATMQRRRLPQPEPVLGGNSQFDLHPRRDEILISSPNRDQWLDLYSLDLVTDKLHYLFELREYTCCPVWDHQGAGVVLMGEYPARNLIRYDLKGRDREVLLRVPHRVAEPARHPNGVDFLYAGVSMNRDIGYLSFKETDHTNILVDASVDDSLGVISPDDRFLAFISERAGQDEVWVMDWVGGTVRKLTDFGDSRYFYDLQWSPDGSYLASMTINQIDLIHVPDGQVRQLKLDREEIRVLSWRDARTISFSLWREGVWRIHDYDIAADSLTPYAGDEIYVHHAPVAEDSLWMGRDGGLFYGPQRLPLEGNFEYPFYRRRFNLEKHGDAVFQVRAQHGANYLIRHGLDDGMETRLLLMGQDMRFSIGLEGVYFSKTISYDADIYRTVADE